MTQTGDRLKPIKVYVTESERAAIEVNASACAVTVSAYLRTLGSGYEPKSMLGQKAILSLIGVVADQGRLGGLLKLWLTERPDGGALTLEVRRLLRQIEGVQENLRAVVKELRPRRK